jgi:hypothetical protein
MKNSALNRKSCSSNPSMHWHKSSNDLGHIDFLSPRNLGGRVTVTQNQKRILTPRSDSNFLSSVGFLPEKRLISLPKEPKLTDIHLTHLDRLLPDRQEAKDLLMWLDTNLQQVLSESSDPDQIFEKSQKIYSHCLNEIIKQVSAHCKERGIVIERVWRAYQTVFERNQKTLNAKLLSLEEKQSQDKTNLHKMYNKQLRKLEKKLEESDNKLKESLKIANDLEILCKSLQNIEDNLKIRLKTVQGRYKLAKRDVLLLKEELRVFNFQVSNIGVLQNPKPSPLARLHHRIKVKSQLTIEKELEKDPILADVTVLVTEDTNKLLEDLKVFGNKYLEQMQNERFTLDDFKDTGTDALVIVFIENSCQTQVEDLCGECIGVKKRRNHLQTKLQMLSPSPSLTSNMYSRSNSFIVSSEQPTNIVDGKKKHERIKSFLNICKNVLNK